MIEKIGLQLYTVREHFKTPEMASETFRKLKSLGYDQAQTAGCYGMDYELFYNLAKEQGIEIVGTHDNFTMMTTDLPTAVDNHKKLHTTNMGIGGFFPPELNVETVEAFIEDANKVAAGIAKEGMKFTYHNHSHEFVRLANGKTVMEMLIEGLDPANTSFVLDTYWVQNAGGDVCSWIEKLAGRIDILHLKDMEYIAEKNEEGQKVYHNNITAVGRGNMDFFKIVDAAQKAGVKYYCVEQDNCPFDFENDLKFSSDFLHKNFM